MKKPRNINLNFFTANLFCTKDTFCTLRVDQFFVLTEYFEKCINSEYVWNQKVVKGNVIYCFMSEPTKIYQKMNAMGMEIEELRIFGLEHEKR